MKQCRMCAKFWLVLAISIAMLCGCQSSPDNQQVPKADAMPAKQVMPFQQLIIQFKPHTIQCDMAGIAQLSQSTGIQLEFVRMMSGQACVVRQFIGLDGEFSAGQSKLRQHPAVESIEPDAIRKAL